MTDAKIPNGTRYKNEYGQTPLPVQSHVVESAHGYSPIPPMENMPRDPMGYIPSEKRGK